MNTVDVVIPTYKPGKRLAYILQMLNNQTRSINKIILMNTEKKYYDAFEKKYSEIKQYNNLLVYHVSKDEFDHGKTRGIGVSYSDADYFICMTDDAIPYDNQLVEKLIKPIEEGLAASSYGRQLAKKDISEAEKFTRRFNYPVKSFAKTKDDIERLGIKTYFCSNVCAAYDRSIYNELGGFPERTIFNEDMIYASKVINAGYTIWYEADAKVIHSHKYTNWQQLTRNFDLGVSHSQYADIFSKVPPAKEGVKLVKATVNHLISVNKAWQIPSLFITSGFKYAGFFLGKRYRMLPKGLVKKISMNKSYWNKR